MRTRTLVSLAVIAVLAFAPGPASAGGAAAASFPGASVLLRVFTSPPPAGSVAQREARVPAVAAGHGLVDIPDAIAPAADLVRVKTVLYAGASPRSDRFDLGGPCPRATTCPLYLVSPMKRKTDTTGRVVVPFAYNDTGRRALRAPDESVVRAALSRAMAQWSHWNSNIVFVDVGSSDVQFGADGKDGGCADGVNVITWGRFPQEVLGAADTCLDRTQKIVRDTDLALNVSHRWVDGIDRRPMSYDLQSIFTHELGHWLSLQHPQIIFGASQTMYGSAEPNEIRKRTLALGDIEGVQAAYTCGAGDSCPRTGIVDD